MQELNATVQSGGERAVATAAFMLALQESTPVPFRCVDEINQGKNLLLYLMMVKWFSMLLHYYFVLYKAMTLVLVSRPWVDFPASFLKIQNMLLCFVSPANRTLKGFCFGSACFVLLIFFCCPFDTHWFNLKRQMDIFELLC